MSWEIFSISPKHMLLPLLESSRRDGSNEGSQHMISLRNKKQISLNYRQYPLLPGALEIHK